MLVQASDPISFAPLGAAILCTSGLILLSERPHQALITAVGAAAAIAAWTGLWYVASTALVPHLIESDPWPIRLAEGWRHIFALNAAAAVAAWLPVMLTAALVSRGLHFAGERPTLFGLPWLAGFVLPLIGQNGRTSPESASLLALSLILGLLLMLALSGLARKVV